MDHSYTINDLSQITGTTRRSIRNYVEQGLIDAPDTIGRNARYSQRHLEALQAIRALRDGHGMSIREIRSALLFANPEVIKELAREVKVSESTKSQVTQKRPNSALNYLRSLRVGTEASSIQTEPTAALKAPSSQLRQEDALAGPVAGLSPVERLLKNIEQLGDGRPVVQKARGEQWVRIPVTPDIEISVRDASAPEHVARLEAIADRLRILLMEEDAFDNRD